MLKDQKIIAAIKEDKNHRVMKSLYKEVLPGVKQFVRNNGGNETQAEDCFQEAVVALIIAVKEGRFKEENSVAAYLKGVVRYKWFDQFKTKLREEEAALALIEEEKIEIPKVSEDQTKSLQLLLSNIGEQCEKLIRLSVFEGHSYADIARIMDKANEGVIKTSVYRCRKKLKEMVMNTPGLLSRLQF